MIADKSSILLQNETCKRVKIKRWYNALTASNSNTGISQGQIDVGLCRLLTSLKEFSISLMSIAFAWLSFLLLIEVHVLLGTTSDDNDAELSSLSCFSTEIPATCLSASSVGCRSSLSVFTGVHLILVELTDVVVVAVSEFSADVADFVVGTLLKGVGKDANFCARIFTGRLQTAPTQCPHFVVFVILSVRNSYSANRCS